LAKRKKLQFKAVNEKMPKKEKKKSWKERQRERQIKQQRVQEAYQIQSEREAKRKPRQWPKGKILAAVCLIIIILGAYGVWQYAQTSTPSDGTTPVTPTPGVIYIRPDGQVSPSTAPILNDGNSRYTLTADIYDRIIVGRNNIVIDGANHALQGTGEYGSRGIDLTGRSEVAITNMEISGFDYGVYLSSASNNVISQNDFTDNYCAIWIVVSSNDNIFSGNKIENNKMYAMWLKDSSNNAISENHITSHANYTIYVRASNYTTFSANYIADNRLGFFFYEASDNTIYHNRFVNNYGAVSCIDSTNVWDNGYPSGGNYWSDYEEKYPDAGELEGSGIWNMPYVIDDDNQDNYPLIDPWSP
jgi:parallel beta-helix repeat protein